MAVIKNNVLTHGASGMIGGVMVFRNYKGKTIVCNRPKKPSKQSPVQKENRTKFKRAAAFAKQMMADPVKKAEYWEIAKKLDLPNAYTAAITEYMRKPEIKDIETSELSDQENRNIKVKVSKKGFEVERVEVIILDKAKKVIEKGDAIKKDLEDWTYGLKASVEMGEMLYILVRARERTGNFTEKKSTLIQAAFLNNLSR